MNRPSTLKQAALALLVATAGCRDKDPTPVTDGQVEIVNATRENIDLIPTDVFTPSAINTSIPRTEIPDRLKLLLGDNGRLTIPPAEYDPSKPNLYLIANLHFPVDSTEKPESTYAIQERIVRIFHILHALGVKRQFLEGVPTSFELAHDVNYHGTESPAIALPLYKKTHKINRATRAIEGIYGAEVESRGVEMDLVELSKIKQNFDSLDKNLFPKARTEIMNALAQRLGIPVDVSRMNDKDYLYREVVPAIRLKLSNGPQAFVDALVNEVVLGNIDYRKVMEAAARFHYVRTKVRNKKYAENINQLQADRADAAFIVGTLHVPHLRKLLIGYNVFVISPAGVGGNSADSRFDSFLTEEDYFNNLLASDLFWFGVNQDRPTVEVVYE